MRTRSMISGRFTAVCMYVCMASAAFGQVRVATNGNVGIGTLNPQHRLDVNGNVRFDYWTDLYIQLHSTGGTSMPVIFPETNNYLQIGRTDRWANHLWCYVISYQSLNKVSDVNIKENVQEAGRVLPKLEQLRVYTYRYKDEYFKNFTEEQKRRSKRTEFGFIAQELNNLFPELVITPDSGLMGIDYVAMIPVLTQAIKELSERVKYLESGGKGRPKSGVAAELGPVAGAGGNAPDEAPGAALLQNTPNPFTTDTRIGYHLPAAVSTATLYIYNMQGAQLRAYPLHQRGHGAHTIFASELTPGMYLYTLIADGREVDTKRMILTK